MNTIVPFFELDGVRYEIKRTRWLLAEYEKLGEEKRLSDEDRTNSIKLQSLAGEVQRYAELMRKLWSEYTENFDDETERRYLKVKVLYENALGSLAKFEVESGCTARVQKAGVDLLEKVAILGLSEQYFDGDYGKAKDLWVRFVESLGKSQVPEWLGSMAQCLFKDEDEEENPFIAQMREKAEKQAENRKNGLKLVK